jgi:hypothetical protein
MSDLMTKDPLIELEELTGSVIQGDEDTKAITDYLTTEITDVFSGTERQQMEADWRKWRRQREARP